MWHNRENPWFYLKQSELIYASSELVKSGMKIVKNNINAWGHKFKKKWKSMYDKDAHMNKTKTTRNMQNARANQFTITE